jgi:hypothetical protein
MPAIILRNRAGRALLCRLQELIADAQTGEALLDIQALQLGNVCDLDHGVAGIKLDLRKADEVVVGLGHYQRGTWFGHQTGDGRGCERLQDFIGNRVANALGGVGVEEHLHAQYANAQRIIRGGVAKNDCRHRASVCAARAGACMLWATVWVGNERALGFYPRRGYEALGSPIYTFQGETHGNRLFGKALSVTAP